MLAIYELANSFRHGWGVERDPVAARSYYETAANLGDADAMNEVAKCYEEGLGGKKDRVSISFSLSINQDYGARRVVVESRDFLSHWSPTSGGFLIIIVITRKRLSSGTNASLANIL